MELYDPNDIGPQMNDYRLKFLSFYVKHSHRFLLDVSCGKGEFLQYWKWKGIPYLTGTEINDECIKVVTEKGFSCTKVDLNNIVLPYRDNTFDVVTCTEVIEHIKDPKKVIEELCRVSSEVVLITTPVANSYSSPDHINFWNSTRHLYESLLTESKYPFRIDTFVTKLEDVQTGQASFIIVIFTNA